MTVSLVENVALGMSNTYAIRPALDALGNASAVSIIPVPGSEEFIPLSAIQSLFSGGEKGAIWDYTDESQAFQDTSGTTAITSGGQPVARVNDRSGLGNNLLQSTSVRRTMFAQGALFDGVDDGLTASSMAWGTSKHLTCVMSLLEGYHAYAYGMLDSYSFGFGAGYIGHYDIETHEVSFVNPTSKFPSGQLLSRKVLDYSFDTTKVTQSEAIVVNVDGVSMTPTIHVASQNYSQNIGPVTLYAGLYNGDNYPASGERYRQVIINRPLTAPEMTTVRQWCIEGIPVYPSGLTADVNMFQITGQSLAEGAQTGSPLTTSQEYDNVMFTLLENTPTAWVSAVNVTTNLESPMYGQIGYLKSLISGYGGSSGYQMLGCNNGVGSASILVLQKGSSAFTTAMTQVAAAKSIATGLGKTFKFRAVAFVQGEADNLMSKSEYKGTLLRLASDYNHQGKLNAQQSDDVVFITSQVSTNALPAVAIAQLECSIEHELIYLSTPMYHFDYVSPSNQHLTAASSKQLGGYMALVYKAVVVDGGTWEPLRPLSYSQSGSDVTITMHVPVGSLVLDTTLLPAQTNYGFAAFNSGGTPISISSVTLVDTDKVKITTASAIPSGGYITYAQSAQPDPARSLGGCGNLRDQQGDSLTYIGKPLHNWCVLFTQSIV